MTINRDDKYWNVKPSRTTINIIKKDIKGNETEYELGKFNFNENASIFDKINIESGFDKSNNLKNIIMATCCNSGDVSIRVGQDKIKDIDGKDFELRLASTQYMVYFENVVVEEYWFSHFAESQWLVVQGNAIEIKDDTEKCSFKYLPSGTNPEFLCQPLLEKVIPKLKEKLISQYDLLQDTIEEKRRLKFIYDVKEHEIGWGILIKTHEDDRLFSLPGSTKPLNPDLIFRIIRPEDLLCLKFSFYNITIECLGDGDTYLKKINEKEEAFMSVQFNSPQNITEQGIPLSAKGEGEIPKLPIKSLAAAPSRVVFKLKKEKVTYSFDTILDWSSDNFEPSLVPVAQISDPPPDLKPDERENLIPKPPNHKETSIELPWHLFISPLSEGRWKHNKSIVKHGQYTDLWSTKLVTKQDDDASKVRITPTKIRGIWYTEIATEPFEMPLKNNDRKNIVKLSSNFFDLRKGKKNPDRSKFIDPEAINVNLLMLSSLGSWIDVRGYWKKLAMILKKKNILVWKNGHIVGLWEEIIM